MPGSSHASRRKVTSTTKCATRARIAAVGKDQYEEFFSNHRFYRTATLSREYFFGWVTRYAAGKTVLDFACGDGDVALRAAAAGAELTIGIDISNVSVQNASHAADRARPRRTHVLPACRLREHRIAARTRSTLWCARGAASPRCDACLSGDRAHLGARRAGDRVRGARLQSADQALPQSQRPPAHRMGEGAHSQPEGSAVRPSYFDLGGCVTSTWRASPAVWLPGLLPLLNGVDRVLTRIPGVQLMSWMFTLRAVVEEVDGHLKRCEQRLRPAGTLRPDHQPGGVRLRAARWL